MKLISNIKNEYFNGVILPTLVYKVMCSEYNHFIENKRIVGMNDYLLDEYKITVKDILDEIKGNILVSKSGDKYNVFVDNNIKMGELFVDNLMRLVDNGNMEIKGLHLFDTAFKYVEKRIDIFYNYYMKGGF